MNRRAVLKGIASVSGPVIGSVGIPTADRTKSNSEEIQKQQNSEVSEKDVYIAELAGIDGEIGLPELREAYQDLQNNVITFTTLGEIIDVWEDGGVLEGDFDVSFGGPAEESITVTNTGEDVVQARIRIETQFSDNEPIIDTFTDVFTVGETNTYPHPNIYSCHTTGPREIYVTIQEWSASAGMHVDCFPENNEENTAGTRTEKIDND